jgi:hypothetical protein
LKKDIEKLFCKPEWLFLNPIQDTRSGMLDENLVVSKATNILGHILNPVS